MLIKDIKKKTIIERFIKRIVERIDDEENMKY